MSLFQELDLQWHNTVHNNDKPQELISQELLTKYPPKSYTFGLLEKKEY